jgi:hypothetical protein
VNVGVDSFVMVVVSFGTTCFISFVLSAPQPSNSTLIEIALTSILICFTFNLLNFFFKVLDYINFDNLKFGDMPVINRDTLKLPEL